MTPRRDGLRRGAYLLPSLLTIGGLILGSYAAVRGLRGDFAVAALLILTGGILDGLDGYTARLTGTESEFGRQFDSLSDVLTFGAVPALLVHLWCRADFGRPSWLIPVFFLVCTATRLARFNVQASTSDSRWFVGLPAPAAAGALCSIFIFASDRGSTDWVAPTLLGSSVVLAALMISTFRYPSLKNADLRRRWSYRLALPVVAVALLMIYDLPASLLGLSALFTASGPVTWLLWRRRGAQAVAGSAADIQEEP